jgi:hypothetical protein
MQTINQTKALMDLAIGKVETSTNQAIKAMAKREYLLDSPTQVAWREALKPGDVCYITDVAGSSYGPHFHRVIKIGRLLIHTRGLNANHDFHGDYYEHPYPGRFMRDTGLMRSCGGWGITDAPSLPWHQKGLDEATYKELWLSYSPYSWRNPDNQTDEYNTEPYYKVPTEDQLHEQWVKYKMTDDANA